MAVRSGTGFSVRLDDVFGEGPSRVIVCVAPEHAGTVEERARSAGVPVLAIGVAGGDRIVVDGLVDIALDEAEHAWRERLPAALGGGAVHD